MDLSVRVQKHIERLFPAFQQKMVATILKEECGFTLPSISEETPELLERIQCAALKTSNGDLERLREAARLAQTDWRDLLVAAGFEQDLKSHERWGA